VSPHRQHDAEALTPATSLLPDRHKEDPFFTEPGASLHSLNCDREWWIGRLDPSLSSNSGKLFTATVLDQPARDRPTKCEDSRNGGVRGSAFLRRVA